MRRAHGHEEAAHDQVVGECRCEIVNMSRANLQPRAMFRTSTSVRPSSKVGVMPTSANKKEIAVSVVLVIVGRSDVAAGPHGTAAAVLRLKRLCAFPRAVLASISTIRSKQLSVTVVPRVT